MGLGLSSELPEVLKRQQEDTEKIIRETYPEDKGDEGAKPDKEAAPETKAKEPEKPPVEEKKPEEAKAAEEKPPEKEEPPKADTPPEGYIAKAEYDKMEQRYKVLQGKYDKEVPDMHESLRALKDKVEELKAKPKEEEKPKPKSPTSRESLFPQDWQERKNRYLEDYGNEYGEDTAYLALEKFMNTLGIDDLQELKKDDLRQELKTVKDTTIRTTKDRYFADLDGLAPNWRTLIEDNEFVDWINQEEGNTGYARRDFMAAHDQNFNAKKVAKYYTDFESLRASPPKETPSPKPNSEKSGVNAPDKESLISPKATPTADKPGSDDGIPWIKASEMESFTLKVKRGELKDEKKVKETLARFDKSIVAGKVIQDM